jgi:hypothetical protein
MVNVIADSAASPTREIGPMIETSGLRSELQALEQLDLTCMVEIMGGDPTDQGLVAYFAARRLVTECFRRQGNDSGTQGAVLGG